MMELGDLNGRLRRNIRASLAAIQVKSSSRHLILEDLLRKLLIHTPSIGKLVVRILAEFGQDEVRSVAADLIGSYGDYEGTRFEAGDGPTVVDMLIVTVKDSELEACKLAFGIDDETRPRPVAAPGAHVWTGEIQGRTFVLVKIGRAGNIQATLAVIDLARYFAPRLAILLGMAGGAQKVRLGHVVIPTNIYDYELSRLTKAGPQDESDAYDASASLVTYFADSERVRIWREEFESELDSLYLAFKPSEMPTRSAVDIPSFAIFTEPVMSGGLLFEDGSARKKAVAVNGRIVAVDMESAGFAAACKQLGWSWRVVRGIADYGQPRRDKRWQRLSTYGAALYVRMFFPPLGFFPEVEAVIEDDLED